MGTNLMMLMMLINKKNDVDQQQQQKQNDVDQQAVPNHSSWVSTLPPQHPTLPPTTALLWTTTRLVASRGTAWRLEHFFKLWNLNQRPLLKVLMLGHTMSTLYVEALPFASINNFKDGISSLDFIL